MHLHPGEPEAVGWRVTTVLDAVRQLRDASPGVTGRPRVIAIDGRGGAGKTTLAERLCGAVPGSAVVHTDDIAWNHAYFDWGGVLAEHVLRPLHRGEAVDFRPAAWINHDRPGSITVPAAADVTERIGLVATQNTAVDGFNLLPQLLPGTVEDVVDRLVPELQDRGVYRTAYEGTTLREHLDLPAA